MNFRLNIESLKIISLTCEKNYHHFLNFIIHFRLLENNIVKKYKLPLEKISNKIFDNAFHFI